MVLFDHGDQISVTASDESLRLLLLTGKPLNESFCRRGPIVVKTQGELDLAFREYQEGTFIKK